MNEFNQFNNNEIEVEAMESVDMASAEKSRKPKKPKKDHTTAKVTALLLAVIIAGGGAGFGGSYFAGKLNSSQAVIAGENGNSSAGDNNGENSDDKHENGQSNQGTTAPTLNELQKDAAALQHTVNENVELNSDGTYKYTRDLVKAVQDSIVYIEVFQNYRGKSQLAGSASGIIISSDGYIVTNNHVVEGEDSYTVKVNNTADGIAESKTYDAKLIGTDSDTDLAVIKIEAENLPVAKLGDSDKLCLGDDVVAIGNPLGLESSVSKGIVSGLNRQISDSRRGLSSIQTDAPINSGNSGGALFNGYGEVVGVVNEKYVYDYAENVGFAITINEAKDVINDLIAKGYVSGRAVIGIMYLEVTDSIAAYNGITAGWQVTEINSDMPVAKSGLLVGDTIVKIDGLDVLKEDVSEIFTTKKPGDTVTVTVVRSDSLGRKRNVNIKIELSESKG
ncbi:MAG: S1C family serine protease [Oscillospiraceae bacterium]